MIDVVVGHDGTARIVAGDRVLGVRRSGEEMPPHHAPRPSWHPLRTVDGATFTEDGPADHPWHHGLSIAVANVAVDGHRDAATSWGGPTFQDGAYRDLANAARQRTRAMSATGRVLTEEIDWIGRDGRLLLTETRESRVAKTSDGWSLTIAPRWRAHRDLGFGSPTTAGRPDAGYGGLFLRGSDALLGAGVVLDGIDTPADEAMGTTAYQCALVRAATSITMNADRPTPWFLRTDPVVMLCAAPFFHETMELAAGSQTSWSWGVEIRS
ncbi:DUF6807 family protein [Jiangella alkaliphila]|uniref:Methane oxygenase PmoA n=1 Tax=Jiangella alkaliphila TaxID=419479 RepID=A0A1H2L747_9ACTN|nr:DUF6807 family protein [Jiangella alkaliphila]SDU76870.1 Methane oxygenase PmoA [Jiangella alkaliphila]